MFVLVFYCPLEHVERVKEAVFAAGAGTVGNYDKCAWQCVGMGQFRPLPGANPFLGTVDKLERVEEARVEIDVREKVIKEVIKALKCTHPYEEPAYTVLKVFADF